MARQSWHILRETDAVTVARHVPVRFDLLVNAHLPAPAGVSLRAVAQQVRQDLWRALQRIRGLSPVVRVTRVSEGLLVEAGGRLARPQQAGGADAALAHVLADPRNRQRWLAHAAHTGRRADG